MLTPAAAAAAAAPPPPPPLGLCAGDEALSECSFRLGAGVDAAVEEEDGGDGGRPNGVSSDVRTGDSASSSSSSSSCPSWTWSASSPSGGDVGGGVAGFCVWLRLRLWPRLLLRGAVLTLERALGVALRLRLRLRLAVAFDLGGAFVLLFFFVVVFAAFTFASSFFGAFLRVLRRVPGVGAGVLDRVLRRVGAGVALARLLRRVATGGLVFLVFVARADAGAGVFLVVARELLRRDAAVDFGALVLLLARAGVGAGDFVRDRDCRAVGGFFAFAFAFLAVLAASCCSFFTLLDDRVGAAEAAACVCLTREDRRSETPPPVSLAVLLAARVDLRRAVVGSAAGAAAAPRRELRRSDMVDNLGCC